MLAVAFTGPSNSGKTTLIKKVSSHLIKSNKRVSIIKHDPKDKAVFDTKGKDSQLFFETGADVAVVSPTRTTMFFQRNYSIDDIISKFGNRDFVLVEGLKWIELPRVGIFRGKIDESYLDRVDAIAIDDTINPKDYNLPERIDILDLNSVDEVVSWIYQNAKKIEE
jgi:molybdopterin-guanine dinucleotide biosynthesis protein B